MCASEGERCTKRREAVLDDGPSRPKMVHETCGEHLGRAGMGEVDEAFQDGYHLEVGGVRAST